MLGAVIGTLDAEVRNVTLAIARGEGSATEDQGTAGLTLSASSDEFHAEDNGPMLVCRAAVVVLRAAGEHVARLPIPEIREHSADVEIQLRQALDADPRVAEVLPAAGKQDVDNAKAVQFFEGDEGQRDFTKSFSRYLALRLNAPIEFVVRVPRKNQPKYRSMDDVPSDEYRVIWDGIVALVLWRQESRAATGSGGHVVLDILEDAGELSGWGIDVLACAPGCLHRFMHADFVLFETPCKDRADTHSHGEVYVGKSVILPIAADLENLTSSLRRVFSLLDSTFALFAEVRSRADGVEFLEWRIHAYCAELLTIQYMRASRRSMARPWQWVADTWRLRGSRRTVREDVSAAWLALATIQAEIDVWQRLSSILDRRKVEAGLEEIDEVLDVGQSAIRGLDLTLARELVTEVSNRRDGKMLLIATGAGAVAAALGAAASSLLAG